MRDDFNIHLRCPWGCFGEIIADRREKMKVSVMCNCCRNTNFYIVNMYSMRTYRAKSRDSKNYPYHLKCPCCGKGEITADRNGDVRISVICCKCNSAYIADFKNMKSYPSGKIRRK